MKRILSILLSVALITSLLVSMSVTSFAEAYREMGEDIAFVETKVVAITADEYAAATGKTLTSGKFAWKMTSYVEPKEGYELNIQWVDDGSEDGVYVGRVISGISYVYQFSDTVIYKKTPTPGVHVFYGGDSPLKDFALGTKDTSRITYVWAPVSFDDYYPWNEAIANDAYDWENGDVKESFTLTTYFATNVDTFDFNAEIVMDNAKIEPDASSTIVGDYIRPEYFEDISVVNGVQVGDEEEPATHSFVVYGEGDVELANETIAEGEAVSMPVAPAVEGKTFSHWATTKGGSAVEPATTMGTEDLTYYAVYTVNKYTITFIVDGNTTTKEVEHGVIPTFDGSLVKDGWTFTGWDKEIVAATGAATYTAQFEENAPTQYEITFIVNGVETKVMTNAGDTPVFTGSTEVDGYTFKGWNPTLAPATGAATYTAILEAVEEPVDSAVTITNVTRITGDIFPESGLGEVTVTSFGNDYKVSAARLHRVHTTFNYDASAGTLKEMGMLFVPKAVADEAGVSTAEEIANAGIAKDANCRSLPAEITGGTTGVVFKAGLVDVPAELKGITIYAIPYYTLSGGTRQYHDVINTTF